jgi:hypothetical protein
MRIMRADEMIEVEGDEMVVFHPYCGMQVQEIQDTILERHPHIFDDCDDRAAFEDGQGNLLTLDQCPCCGGNFVWVLEGPQGGEVRVSRRLLAHAELAPLPA